jgi:hypothetical protein
MLGLSSVVYIAAYFPVVPAVDYRYTYWPVVACCVSGVLVLLDRRVPAATGTVRPTNSRQTRASRPGAPLEP